MKKISLILLILIPLCGAAEGFSDHAMQTPISNFMNADWERFADELEMTAEVHFCGEGLKKAIGFKGHMIEPVGFIEITNTPGRLLSIDLEIFNSDSWYQWGAVDEDDVGRQSQTHYITFPVLGMISEGKLSSWFCFTGGDLSLGYMTELNLVRQSLAVRLSEFADMLKMFNMAGILTSIFDCMATETDGSLDRPQKYSATIRNSLYMFTGCIGSVPIGDMGGETGDPLVDGLLLANGMMNDMFTLTQFKKTTNYAAGKDSMCEEQTSLRNIDAQWAVQLFYPVVGKSVEYGTTPLDYSSFKNVPDSMDDVVYLLWKRRDFAQGAYSCPNNSAANK